MDAPVFSSADVADHFLTVCSAALTACQRPEPGRAYVASGLVPWDDCCAGQLTVSVERAYRSEVFPAEATTDERCYGGQYVTAILVTLTRCVPTEPESPQSIGPSAATLDAAHRDYYADAAALWNAVVGPLPDGWERSSVSQTFVGPEGGCIAIETRALIGVGDYLCPCPDGGA